MTDTSSDWRRKTQTIRFRLLFILFILLAVSMAVSMLGIWRFERDRLMETSRQEAISAVRTIEKGLRGAMLVNDWARISDTVHDIHDVVPSSAINVLSPDGTIAVSSDPGKVGQKIDRYSDPSCVVCHTTAQTKPKRHDIFLETEDGPFLRNIITIGNGPQCYGCHPAEQLTLGVIIYDALFANTYQMLHILLSRIALTGMVTFVLLIVILSVVIQRVVHRPLNQLLEGFLQVGLGNFKHWVTIEVPGEIQEMGDQFNVMTRAIDRSFAEIKRKNWETKSLYTFVQQLGRAIEWKELQRIVIDLLFDTFTLDYAGMLLRQEGKEGDFFEASWRQVGNPRFQHGEYDARAITDGIPNEVLTVWAEWRGGQLNQARFTDHETTVYLPLVSKNIAIGLICLRGPAGRGFSEAEKKLVVTVGEQACIALANARLYRMAITDPLTDMYTRRYCDVSLRKMLDAHEPKDGRGFCVLMLDIDHFKSVNDTHGHPVGDEVLIQLAGLIRDNIRYNDVACRFGGEEFIVLVNGTLAIGEQTGHRLQEVIERHPFDTQAGELRNTVSIGVAHFPQHGQNGDQMISAADQALYLAKTQGRNRVVCFQA